MFYENFERICRERGLKPSRACIEAGMKANRSANWKTTSALPKQEELYALAGVLSCTVADFFDDGGQIRDPQGHALSEVELTLLEHFNRLDAMGQAEVLVYTRDLCRNDEEEAKRRYGA